MVRKKMEFSRKAEEKKKETRKKHCFVCQCTRTLKHRRALSSGPDF